MYRKRTMAFFLRAIKIRLEVILILLDELVLMLLIEFIEVGKGISTPLTNGPEIGCFISVLGLTDSR